MESLLTMVTTTGQYTRSHRLRWELLLAQSQALAVPLYQRRASWDTYERVIKRAVASLKRGGVQGGIFGDVALNEHREWWKGSTLKRGSFRCFPSGAQKAKPFYAHLSRRDLRR